MATIYKVELVSHFTNYTKKELEKLLIDAIKKDKKLTKGNQITLEVKERK